MDRKILITKDVLRKDYLPCYGNKYWKTPNIDELAQKGTIFNRHYAAGTSTAMSITSMFTGKNSFEINRKKYEEVDEYNESETLFSKLNENGYKTCVIWPFEWKELAWKYSKVFPKESTVISLKNISQNIVRDIDRDLIRDDTKASVSLNSILKEIENIISNKKKIFIWLHLPHVINGRTSYGSDIDLFDKFVGEIRKIFDDDSIYISADHGHMNCEKGIPVYGFHVYEGAIRIPLITPKIMGQSEINFPTSNVQLMDIILDNNVEKNKYVYSDTQYYLQENRKLAIIKDNYKYIYNKRNKSEELYDLEYDPNENVNLLIEYWYEKNRDKKYLLEKIYFYPFWGRLKEVYLELKNEKNRIWREGSWIIESLYKLNNFRKKGLSNISNLFIRKDTVIGRWNCRAQK